MMLLQCVLRFWFLVPAYFVCLLSKYKLNSICWHNHSKIVICWGSLFAPLAKYLSTFQVNAWFLKLLMNLSFFVMVKIFGRENNNKKIYLYMFIHGCNDLLNKENLIYELLD